MTNSDTKMLKKRIIVTLTHDGKGNVVKPIGFTRPGRKVGTLQQHVRILSQRNIDELILLDITATEERRQQNWKLVSQVAEQLTCPLAIGGSIKSTEDIKNAFNSGADKVVIRSHNSPTAFIRYLAKWIGSQSVIYAMDLSKRRFVNGECTPEDIDSALRGLTEAGIGELMITSADIDGTMSGYDLALLASIVSEFKVKVPIIFNGGCSGVADMAEAFKFGADAVAASSVFLYTALTPKDCARELANKGFNVRYEDKPNK